MDQIISTAHLPEQERFDFWRDETSKRHLQYDIERYGTDEPFQAELRGAILGDIIFATSCLSAIRGHRTPQNIAADSLDHYVLGIPVKRSIVVQDGIEYVLGEDEAVLFDGTRPLHYRHGDGGGGVTVVIPRARLDKSLANAEVRGPRVAPLDHGIGLMVRSFCQALPGVMESGPGAEIRQGLAEQLTSLIALTFQASDEGLARAKPTLSSLRFQAIKDFIGMNLHDSDLNPDRLVQALGISRSYLYKLFAQHNFSFQGHLRTRRLTRIATDLRNPALSNLSITDIAVRGGFNNTSHFSRCFSEQYGESPRAYRARMLNPGN